MFPYASCVCLGADRKRRRPWKLVVAQTGASMCIGKDEALCIRFRGSHDSITSLLSASEICMLEAVKRSERTCVACGEARRRPRQPVITRLFHLHLLDDTYAGVTSTLLSKCNSWSFNTFNLDVSTGGRSLSYLLVHLFQQYQFIQHFQLDIVKVWHCFNLMEAAYHRHNPYHNSVHAADVTQAMHCFLQENKFAAHLTPLEAMTSVIAAVAHDLDHPGVTQAFLVATSNHLVNLYHNSSVLENHHWRTAISCLSESGIFNHLRKDVWLDIQKQIRSLILATDITRQKEFLARFKSYLNTECLDMEQTQYRHFALQIALKCADLCNPCRPWAISQRWSYQVCQEFYRQGAYERQLKLPLTPTFDCSRTKVAKIQADFFEFVVSPLFETWNHFLQTPLSGLLLENLHHNHLQWQNQMELMQRNEVDTPQIQVDTCSDSSSFSDEGNNRQHLTVLKQHRSKSDSGLIPPSMETYSTEELHPSTTLLSLSSITNTVQLRKVYAATEVQSHLICPTTFFSSKKSESNAQSSVHLSCTDGCGTPSHLKQRSKSLINDSEALKYFSQVLHSRRASDIGPTNSQPFCDKSNNQSLLLCQNNLCPASSCTCENETPSWCWHISRSFSEERPIRPSQDFDGRSGRRGSAPVAISQINKLKKSARRWSVPSETVAGIHVSTHLNPKLSTTSHRIRRSSFELLTSTRYENRNLKNTRYGSSISDSILFCHPALGPSSPMDGSRSSCQKSPLLLAQDKTFLSESPSDLISVLIGPSGMLNSMCAAQETNRRTFKLFPWSSHIMYQQRRSSVPLNVSLLSLSSGK